jgi:hypothetical protein
MTSFAAKMKFEGLTSVSVGSPILATRPTERGGEVQQLFPKLMNLKRNYSLIPKAIRKASAISGWTSGLKPSAS